MGLFRSARVDVPDPFQAAPGRANSALDVGEDHGAETDALEDDDIREHLRSALPGSGETLEARVDAVIDLYQFIRDHDGDAVTTAP